MLKSSPADKPGTHNDQLLTDFNEQLSKVQAALVDLEGATDKTIEQENRVESQVEAFGAMFDQFEAN